MIVILRFSVRRHNGRFKSNCVAPIYARSSYIHQRNITFLSFFFLKSSENVGLTFSLCLLIDQTKERDQHFPTRAKHANLQKFLIDRLINNVQRSAGSNWRGRARAFLALQWTQNLARAIS